MKLTHLLAVTAILIVAASSRAQMQGSSFDTPAAPPHPIASIQDTETAAQKDARMAWWRQARFGMFIHWGLYSIPAGTWDGKQVPSIGEWIMNNASIPVADYKALAAAVQPHRLQRARHRRAGQIRRHEVHRHHRQAPRRLRHVRLQGELVQHRRRHALPSRPAARAGRRSAASRASSSASTTRRIRTGPRPAHPRFCAGNHDPVTHHWDPGAGRRLRHLSAHQGHPADQGAADATTETSPPSSGSTRPPPT